MFFFNFQTLISETRLRRQGQLLHKQFLVFGNPTFFSRGQKTKSLQLELWVLFSKPKLRHAQSKIRQIVTDICDVGSTLTDRSYVWQDPLQLFSGAKKNKNFTLAPTLTLRNLQMEIREIIGIYVAQVVLTNAHLGSGGPSPTFYRGANSTRTGESRWALHAFLFVFTGPHILHNTSEHHKCMHIAQ